MKWPLNSVLRHRMVIQPCVMATCKKKQKYEYARETFRHLSSSVIWSAKERDENEREWKSMDGYPMRPSLSYSFPLFLSPSECVICGEWVDICVLGWLRIQSCVKKILSGFGHGWLELCAFVHFGGGQKNLLGDSPNLTWMFLHCSVHTGRREFEKEETKEGRLPDIFSYWSILYVFWAASRARLSLSLSLSELALSRCWAMLCVFPWEESLEEEKGREEEEKLFETGKWRLLPTPTTLWSFSFLSELGRVGCWT